MTNAKALIFEAEALNSVSAYARALVLAHLAREEISKCGILHAAGTRLLAGIPVDWKKTMRRLRGPKAKLELETVNLLLLVSATSKIGAVPDIVEPEMIGRTLRFMWASLTAKRFFHPKFLLKSRPREQLN